LAWYGVITDAGRELIAEYVAGLVQMNVNRITVGSGSVSEENMHSSTNLVSYKDDGSIIDTKDLDHGVDFEFEIGPRAAGAYVAKEIGMWANAGENRDVMIALFQNNDGATIPAKSVNPDFVYILSALLAIDNLDNLTITIDSTAYVPFSVYTPYTVATQAQIDGKVDKEEGKGLSHEDYTTAEKSKLAGIEDQANKYVLPKATASVLGGVKVGTGLAVSNDGTISNSAVRSVATGTANGTIAVNTDGTTSNVAVKGLGSAAYQDTNAFALKAHNHDAGNITSGTLPIARGGTGITSNPSMLTNLGSTSADTVMKSAPRPGVTGTLPIANGGTGATTAANARNNLGAAAASHNHNASDINAGTLPIARGGTGLASSPSMLINLASTSAANVMQASPRPGVTGVLPVANGGTGVGSNPSMLVNVGSNSADNVLKTSPRPGVYGTLPVANGGTGATTAANARTNLGAAAVNHTHTVNQITGMPDVMGFFAGDGSKKRKITLGFKPSLVLLFSFGSGFCTGDDSESGGWGSVDPGRTTNVSFWPGHNVIHDGCSNEYITWNTDSQINTYFSRNHGGAAVITDGFLVGNFTENCKFINTPHFYYMYYAWR